MKSLFLNTSTKRLVVAIIDNNKILFNYSSENNNELSSNIMPIIDRAFENASLKPKDIDTIFVTNGPGSFTGIRIGLTIAKVMAWSLKIKVIPLSSLELMASGFKDKLIAPMIDARRDYVFAALYDKDLNQIIEDKYILYNDFITEASNKGYYNSDGESSYVIVSHDLEFVEPEYDIIRVINKHKNDAGINPHILNPNYLKLTEAEEKFNEGR